MSPCDVYLSLGGNIGDTRALLQSALQNIASLEQVADLKVSRFYQTSPVSSIPQESFINVACCFKTTMAANTLLVALQQIERQHGKLPKPKNAPRLIDIDILFYGLEYYATSELDIPHPHWRERLFVIKPLADLVPTISIPNRDDPDNAEVVDLEELLRTFPNIHQETIFVLPETY